VTDRLICVALDGPGSSGKSSVGSAAAKRLGFRFCDTGLLYRAVAWLALERGVDPSETASLVALVSEISLVADADGRLSRVVAAGLDVTDQVAEARVDRAVSSYASVAELRSALVALQRSIAAAGSIIMAGRDIGTAILPDASIKIYLDASVEARASRRALQRETTDPAELERTLADLRRRDGLDATRAAAPLRIATDATVINTDLLDFEQTVDALVDAIKEGVGG
jgi:CMP/dCMP kinase